MVSNVLMVNAPRLMKSHRQHDMSWMAAELAKLAREQNVNFGFLLELAVR